jgi:spermidine synthase
MTAASHVALGEDGGRVALLIDGVIQSVAVSTQPLTSGYWPHMLPGVRPEHALLLGLGGGTIAHLLVERFGPLPITAVEVDHDVVAFAYRFFGLPHGLKVVEADAFAFVETASGPYDYIAVDLFARNSVPAGVFRRSFLRKLRELLTPGGLLAVNYFKDRRAESHRQQLEGVFPRVVIIPSDKNLIAHCRPR